MNLETLLSRAKELENAISGMTSQLHVLHGHKTEIEHWIGKLQESKVDSTPVEPPLEPVVQ